MSRRVVALDRLATVVVALLLIAVGLVLAAWWSGRFDALPPQVDLGRVTSAVTSSWWPWAAALAGLLLVLLGLRWLAAHLPARGVGSFTLPGSGRDGRLLLDAGSAADAAAAELQQTRGVRSARGTVRQDRGQLVAQLTAVLEDEADLALVARAADAVSADLGHVIARDDVRCRVDLHVARRSRDLSRVH